MTVNGTFLPAARVRGRVIPLTVNSAVLRLAFETVMLDPVALSEPLKLLLWPTVTLPKLNVAGLTANWPETDAVPASEIVSDGLEALETTEIDPAALPPVVGVKVAPKVKLCPGARVRGRVKPVALKTVPETLAWVIVTLDPPVLVKVSDWVPVLPSATVKSRLESLVLNTPPVAVVAVRGTVSIALVALLTTARLPLTVPLPCGVKVTLKGTL